MPSLRRKYVPLCQYLEQLPAEQQSVRLTFAAIEALRGSALPPSAHGHDYWLTATMAAINWRRSGWRARLARPDAVVFTRLPRTTPNAPGPLLRHRRGKYGPLCQYLEQLPPEQASIDLSFREIAALIGEPLPHSARTGEYWGSSNVAYSNWRHSGWSGRLEHLDAVRFSRLPAARRDTR